MPIDELYFDADVMIISLVSDDGILGDETMLKEAPFKDEIFTLDEVMEIKNITESKRWLLHYERWRGN